MALLRGSDFGGWSRRLGRWWLPDDGVGVAAGGRSLPHGHVHVAGLSYMALSFVLGVAACVLGQLLVGRLLGRS